MDKKYTVLRTLGKIYKVLGIIGGVLTLLTILGVCATSVLGGMALPRTTPPAWLRCCLAA